MGLGYFVLKHTKFHKYIIDSDGNSDRILAVVVVALNRQRISTGALLVTGIKKEGRLYSPLRHSRLYA